MSYQLLSGDGLSAVARNRGMTGPQGVSPWQHRLFCLHYIAASDLLAVLPLACYLHAIVQDPANIAQDGVSHTVVPLSNMLANEIVASFGGQHVQPVRSLVAQAEAISIPQLQQQIAEGTAPFRWALLVDLPLDLPLPPHLSAVCGQLMARQGPIETLALHIRMPSSISWDVPQALLDGALGVLAGKLVSPSLEVPASLGGVE